MVCLPTPLYDCTPYSQVRHLHKNVNAQLKHSQKLNETPGDDDNDSLFNVSDNEAVNEENDGNDENVELNTVDKKKKTKECDICGKVFLGNGYYHKRSHLGKHLKTIST